MKQSYSKLPGSQQPNKLIIQRICQQIEQDVQTLLKNLCIQDAGTINMKILQKCIISTKNAIIRAVTSRLPQLTAVEEKFKSLFVQINQQLQMHKQKNKDIFTKYQHKILQCDKYKMQTVQLSQLYQLIYKQNIQLKLKLSQRPQQEKKPIETQIQTQYPTNGNKAQIQMQLQQRQLFHQQICRYNILIQQYKDNQIVANDRIQVLLQDINNLHHNIQQLSTTNTLLKNQITKLVIQLQQHKLTIQQHHKIQQHQHNTHQHTIDQLHHTIQSQQNKLKQIQQKLHKMTQYQQKYKQQKQKYRSMHTNMQDKDKRIQQLQRQVSKIKDISRNQSILQNKYAHKFKLITKHNQQLLDKISFYKHQNQRLYQAMSQYQSKQNKLNLIITNNEHKLTKIKLQYQKLLTTNKNIRHKCMQVGKQLKSIKKYYDSSKQSSTNIRTIMQQYKQNIQTMVKQILVKYNRKLAQLQHGWQQKINTTQYKYNGIQKQYKVLQHKCLQSQINSNRIANSLLQSKNQAYVQIGYKDQMIKCLQQQLIKQKQFNQLSIMRLNQVVKKYDNVNYTYPKVVGMLIPQKDHTVVQLQNRVADQKNRFMQLQFQYKAIIGGK